MNEFLYRVCTLDSTDESVEEEYDLPGGKFSLTGFFYQDIHNAIALWRERDNTFPVFLEAARGSRRLLGVQKGLLYSRKLQNIKWA